MDADKRAATRKRAQTIWANLREDEKHALTMCRNDIATRTAIGFGVSLTIMSALAAVRRDSKPLPRLLRYGGGLAFTVTSSYIGGMTAVPQCVARVRALPDSDMVASLQIVVEDWAEARRVRDEMRAQKDVQKQELTRKVVDDSNNGDPDSAK